MKIKKPAKKTQLITMPLLAVIVFLIAVIFWGAAKIDWETARAYKSKAGNYSIRFPVNATLHVNEVKVEGEDRYNPVGNVIELDMPGKSKPYILISHFNNIAYESVEEYAANTSECEEIEDGKGTEVYIGGVRALVYKNIRCNTEGESRIYAINGSMGISVTFNEKEVDEKYLNLILENLSFQN